MKHPKLAAILLSWVECLFNVTLNDILVKYVTSHRCTVGLKKKLNQQLGPNAIAISYGALTCPSSHGHCAELFTPLFPETIPFLSPLMIGMGIRTAILLSCVEKISKKIQGSDIFKGMFRPRNIHTIYQGKGFMRSELLLFLWYICHNSTFETHQLLLFPWRVVTVLKT